MNFSCSVTLQNGWNTVRLYARSYCREVEAILKLYYISSFDKTLSWISSSTNRGEEKYRFKNSFFKDIVKNSCIYNKLYEVVIDENKPLKERIFAFSYLLGEISGYNNLTSIQWNYLRSNEMVEVLKKGLFTQDGKTYMAEKAMWTLVRLDGSKSAGDLILYVLSVVPSYPHFYNMLERHIIGVKSKWLGNLLMKGGFYMSPPAMEENAKGLMPHLDTEAVPFEEFIELLRSDFPIDKKEDALDVLNNILHARKEIPDEIRDQLGSLLYSLKDDPFLRGKVLIGLGLLGGYEEYLLKELKNGEYIPELLYALGEGGDKEVAMKLVDISRDRRLDPWRRIMAGRAAYAIAMRQRLDPEGMFKILLPLIENTYLYAMNVVLDEWEEPWVREEALLFSASITDSVGFSNLLKAVFSTVKEPLLLKEGMRLAVYWADCGIIENINEIENEWNEELKEIENYYDDITDTIIEYQEEIISALIEDKKCEEECEINVLKEAREGLRILDEILETLPPWMEFIRERVETAKADLNFFAEDFTSSIVKVILMDEEGIEELKTMVNVINTDLDLVLGEVMKYTTEELRKESGKVEGEKVKEATRVQKALLDVRKLVKEIEVIIGHIEKKFEKVIKETERMTEKAGFTSLQELVERKNILKGLITQADDNKEVLEKRCSSDDPPQSSILMQMQGSGTVRVEGYTHEEDGDLIGGFKIGFITGWDKVCIWKLCTPIPKVEVEADVDTFGYFESELPPNTHFDLLIETQNAMTEFLQWPWIFLNKNVNSGTSSKTFHLYLPYGSTYPDYDSDRLNDNAEKRIGRKHLPVYYFCPFLRAPRYEEWYPTDPKIYFEKRSNGLKYKISGKEYILPPTPQNFYKISDNPYNQESSYIDTKSTSSGLIDEREGGKPPYEGLPLFHILPFPDDRSMAGSFDGSMGIVIPRQYKTQYFLFHDYSKFTYYVCVFIVCWQDSSTHYGDWEWVCPFIQTQGPSPGWRLTKVVYHYHGSYTTITEIPTYEYNPKRAKVFVAAKSHASYWRDGYHTHKVYFWVPVIAGVIGVDSRDYACSSPVWVPPRFLSNIDAYSVDNYARTIYYFKGKWGKSGESPGGPNSTLSGDRDYNHLDH